MQLHSGVYALVIDPIEKGGCDLHSKLTGSKEKPRFHEQACIIQYSIAPNRIYCRETTAASFSLLNPRNLFSVTFMCSLLEMKHHLVHLHIYIFHLLEGFTFWV